MAIYTDYQWQTVSMPDAASGTNSVGFSVPRGAKTVTIFSPALGGATFKIQLLTPQQSDQDAVAWVDALAVIFAAGASVGSMNLAGFAASSAYTMPIQGIGMSTMRFVASAGQGAVGSQTFYVLWGIDR